MPRCARPSVVVGPPTNLEWGDRGGRRREGGERGEEVRTTRVPWNEAVGERREEDSERG